MFTEILDKYNNCGVFNLEVGESLKEKCNAPSDQSGVYLIYKVVNGEEKLIYIGSSGQRKDGILKTRKGGMRDRLINGYHPNRFGQAKRIKRHIAFSIQMEIEKIGQLKFYWWVTYDNIHSDFPTDVENTIREEYLTIFTKMPEWHN